jgi:hypothetical protein
MTRQAGMLRPVSAQINPNTIATGSNVVKIPKLQPVNIGLSTALKGVLDRCLVEACKFVQETRMSRKVRKRAMAWLPWGLTPRDDGPLIGRLPVNLSPGPGHMQKNIGASIAITF